MSSFDKPSFDPSLYLSEDMPPMSSDAQAFVTQPVKRGKSLVRPERERINPNHRQYHYRQAAGQAHLENIEPSTTGNMPSRSKITNLRRGKSIMGRTEKGGEEFEYALEDQKPSCWDKLPGPWMLWCYLLTFWIPTPVLNYLGVSYGPAQMAWREKIGLVGVIILIMAFVGFLTFGFTQATCFHDGVSVHSNHVTPGYLVIKGWAYALSDWSGHPSPDGNGTTNVLYPSLNGSGMDASFLFPVKELACDHVYIPIQGEQPNYFPCELFDPNKTVPPSVSYYTNRTNCHTSAAAMDLLNLFSTQGVPDKKGKLVKRAKVYYTYSDVNETSHLMIYNGHVLNLRLLQSLPSGYYTVPENGLISRIMANESEFEGRDMTYLINSIRDDGMNWVQEAECLVKTIQVGQVDEISVGCMFPDIVLYVSLVIILAVILVKFALAVIFGWFLSWRLGNFKEDKSYTDRMKRDQEIEAWTNNMRSNGPVTQHQQKKHRSFLPTQSRFTPMVHGSNRYDFGKKNTPAWKTSSSYLSRPTSLPSVSVPSLFVASSQRDSTVSTTANNSNNTQYMTRMVSSFSWDDSVHDNSVLHLPGPPCPLPLSPYVVPKPPADYMPFKYPLAYTFCLVTCYSEGEEGIRCTLDSVAMSDYPKSHTMLLVICDGLITGSGENKSTPDVCIDMMRDFVVPPDEVKAQPYVAIADGAKRNNYAKVYAGFYKYNDETVPPEQQARVPMITIVKCGSSEEANSAKPGNRGKRDSQIILMQFLQKVMFDGRMTMMEYEFFNAIWRVTGVSPDHFEICLMVDADTKLFPDALSRLICAAVKDPEISGLCGETKIANKTQSWVSMIQVFEYYISHHQSKAFESIFGGVTCLPGCFCMYRIKAPKGPDGYWVPILANPDIVQHYSENVVDTLHRKNLLLLGEDRYLTTLMLRTFPHRKMMFIPQAVCKTIVPDSFKVLLSQRRRWINSTVHNLFELILVNDLCGTFCFSMQFFVFMDLVGTLALPAAISFTLYVVILAIIGKPAVVPLVLLALILGLPAVLIVMTSRKVVYVGWMLIYLISLPIWNFILPVYAFWHFDDFSWGDTRKVEGEKKDTGHGDEGGTFDSSVFAMKKWNEFEMERRTKYAQEHNLPHPRFLDHESSRFDIFKDSELSVDRRYSSISNNSAQIPLTQLHYGGSPTPLGIVPDRIQLTDGPVPHVYINEVIQTAKDTEDSQSELDWIQKSAQHNNWANPAPHHGHTTFEEDEVYHDGTPH